MLVAVVVLGAVLTLGARASLWRRVGGAPVSATALVTVACLLSAISLVQYKAPVGVSSLRYYINMTNSADESAVDTEAQKTIRASAKRAVTKQINAICQKFAENETDSIPGMIEHLKQKFKSFSVAHETYVDLESEEHLDECDKYFYQVQGNYISVLKEFTASKVVTSQDNDGDQTCNGAAGSRLSSGSDDLHEQMIALMNLPTVELQTFDGNPVRYHSFIKSFDANVDKVCQDPDLKLTRLLQYVTGTALEAIRSCQLIGGLKGYDRARGILKSRFGSSHLVAEKIVKGLRSGKPVRSPDDIQQLAVDVENASLILEQLGKMHEVNAQSVVIEIVHRLPGYAQLKWKKFALNYKDDKDAYPAFSDLVTFIAKLSRETTDPVYGDFFPKRDKPKPQRQWSSGSGYTKPVNTTQTNTNGRKSHAKSESPCVMCNQPHRLWNCPQFRALTLKDRLHVVNSNKLCHNCLHGSHTAEQCGKKSVCSVVGCGQKHTMWIHDGDHSGMNQASNQTVQNTVVGATASNSEASYFVCSHKDTFMPVVEVTVTNGQKSCKCYALLDTGSGQSFCSRNLAVKLGLKGHKGELNVSTISSTVVMESEVVSFGVSSDVGETLQMDNVFIGDKIPTMNAAVNMDEFPYLNDIQLCSAYDVRNVVVDLLIAQDNSDALVPMDVRRGQRGQPFAVLTMFGWCLNGQIPVNKVMRGVVSNFISARPVDDDVTKLWKLENEGLYDISWSQEDKSVIDLWDKETTNVDNHYVIPIPWRDRDEPLPNNFVVAKSRLDSLSKRLKKENKCDLYQDEMNKLLEKGYAELVPTEETVGSDRIWYIPHHGATTEKKPLRVVFDCACKYKGKSLNDRCHQGPDLINKLLPVLLRFRRHSIAIQGDIEAMYNQVRIPSHDRDALRFLWYIDGKLEYFRMTSHLFGGVWCAASSTYALHRTVSDTPKVDPLVEETVMKSFYVDDCLSSVNEVGAARTVIKETPKVLANGGFSLTKFAVNDAQLLAEIPEKCKAKEVVDFNPDCETKALGIKWRISDDEFIFISGRDMTGPLTRRRMLSLVSSIYDPLGLIGPMILGGKLLFQEATMRKLSWDETVPVDISDKWNAWSQSLININTITFPRCIKPRPFDDALIELHNFSDASSKAYGCCTYLRCVNGQGKINVQLIMSKSRVAPLKACTIPRLELQAAVLAVKIDTYLRQELDLHIVNSVFWSDSEIVLKYIANESRRFHVFVANRVSVIREHSHPDQWNYIKSKSNPADLITRPQSADNLDKDMWLRGPQFLSVHKCYWESGEEPSCELSPNDHEVRKNSASVNVSAISAQSDNDQDRFHSGIIDRVITHYSSWSKMKHALAWLVRYIAFLRGSRDDSKLLVEHVKTAEQILIRDSQRKMFPDDIYMTCL